MHLKRKHKRCDNCYKLHALKQKQKWIKINFEKKNKPVISRQLTYPTIMNVDMLSIVVMYLGDNECKYNVYKQYGNIFKTKCSSCDEVATYCIVTLENIPCAYCDELLSNKGELEFSCQIKCPHSSYYAIDNVSDTDKVYIKMGYRYIDKAECSMYGKRQGYDIDYKLCLI